MTVTDQIKILDRKIMQNEAQYDLDRKAAKISALSFNNLDKYEYLTGKDLDSKPSTKFEYSPLGKIFNKGLDKDDQKEGLFKRLKNIENAQKGLMVIIKINQRVQGVNQVYQEFLVVYQVKVKTKMKMKTKMKKLHVNFIRMELRV